MYTYIIHVHTCNTCTYNTCLFYFQIRVVNAFKAGLDSGDNIHLSRLPHLTTTPKSKRYYGEDQLNCQVSDV